jgi:hypothetical protein
MRLPLNTTIFSLALASFALGGCATTHQFDRVEPPSVVVKDEPTAFGLIDATAVPKSDIGPIVHRALQDAIGGRLEVKTFDLRRQPHEINWDMPGAFEDFESIFTFKPKPEKKPKPSLTLNPEDPVIPPLLVSVYVPRYDDGQAVYMGVTLWTRSAKEISTHWVWAEYVGAPQERLKIMIDGKEVITPSGMTGHPYEKTDDGVDASYVPPSDQAQRALFILKHAFGAVLYPYLSHKRADQLIFVDEPKSLEAGIRTAKQGRYADAFEQFMQVAAAEPKNHGALNNAAQMKWAMGDSKAAAELMKKANAISSTGLSRGLQEKFENAAAERKVIDPGKPPPTAP